MKKQSRPLSLTRQRRVQLIVAILVAAAAVLSAIADLIAAMRG